MNNATVRPLGPSTDNRIERNYRIFSHDVGCYRVAGFPFFVLSLLWLNVFYTTVASTDLE